MASKHKPEGADALSQISPQLFKDLQIANSRLAQIVTPIEVLSALRICADLGKDACILLQPGYSGYAWSDRIIPLVFMSHRGSSIRIRIRRGRSYRNSGASPAIWPELRGFPRGASADKVARWAAAADGVDIAIRTARKQSIAKSIGSLSRWTPERDGTYVDVA